MKLKVNYEGTYEPLDVYEDFEIRYTHQYDNGKGLAGYKIPYTNKFKIPLTSRNRRLLGLPFDISLPKEQRIFGKVTTEEGEFVFDCVYEVERQVINILEPYVEIQMLDKLSDAIQQLSKLSLQDILTGAGTKFLLNETWLYEDFNTVTYPTTAPFSFPFYDWNNKLTSFAYDPMRDLNNLQPTFYVKYLIQMIFDYVGIDINSKFLFEDNQISDGIIAEQLGLMLPCRFYSDNEALFSSNMSGRQYKDNTGLTSHEVSRSPDFLTGIPTSPRLISQNFTDFIPNSDGPKMNWKSYIDITDNDYDYWSSEFCSMVDGELTVQVSPTGVIPKQQILFGTLYSSSDGTKWFDFDTVNTNDFGFFEVHVLMADFWVDLDEVTGSNSSNTVVSGEGFSSITYDSEKSYLVGTAEYVGLTVIPIPLVPDRHALTFEMTFNADAQGVFDVAANQGISLTYVIKTPEGVVYNANVSGQVGSGASGVASYDVVFDGSNMRFKWYSGDEDVFDKMLTYSSNHIYQHTTMQFSFEEPTEYPPVTKEYYDEGNLVSGAQIDLAESYTQATTEFKLIDVVTMVMERFNLSMYSLADGTIHIDSTENRSQGDFYIDSLIDEQVVVEYRYTEIGLLTMKDNNPSFYPDGYNSIEKYVYNDEKKEESIVSFNSAIVRNEGMFEEGYDDTGYELLKVNNNSNYWGTSDRKQAPVDDLVPTFVFLQPKENLVMFPVNDNMKGLVPNWIDPESAYSDVESIIPGFFNSFVQPPDTTLWHHSLATNIMSGYTLESFRDNEIRNTFSTYMMQWRQRVYNLMDNNSVAVTLSAYLDEDDFIKMTAFPTVRYFGDDWTMESFSEYPFSAQNGGVVSVNLNKIEELPPPTEPPEPPSGYTIFRMNGLGETTFDLPCGETQNSVLRYHNGAGSTPVIGDTIYDDVDGEVIFDGSNLWYYMPATTEQIRVNGDVKALRTCEHLLGKPSIITKTSEPIYTPWCGIDPSLSNLRTVYHNGAGTLPVQGDSLFEDESLTIVIDGQSLWWKTGDYTNSSYQISSAGVILVINDCSDRTIFYTATWQSHNTSDACNQSDYPRPFWHDGAGVYPTVGDTIYEEDGTTRNGYERWHKMNNGTLIDINNSGLVTELGTC